MPTRETTQPSRMLGFAVPIAAVIIGTFFFHRYSLLTSLNAVQSDTGDTRFVVAILEHWNNVLHGTAPWRTVPIFWPADDTLAFSDVLLGMGILHAAFRVVSGIFEALNAQTIILTVMTFACSYALLLRGVRLSVWGATLGASFIAFCWPRFAYLPHVQLQFTWPLPLLFLLIVEALRDGLKLTRFEFAWRMVAAACLAALLLATVIYYAVYAALAVVIALTLCLLHGPTRGHLIAVVRHQWPGLTASMFTVALLSAPFILLYLPLLHQSGGRTWLEAMSGLPRPHHFFWMGRENWIWGDFFALWPAAEVTANWPEFRIGVGLVASLAWAVGISWALVLVGRRTLSSSDRMVILFILTGLLLQFSMLALPGGRSAWWLIWRFFPGANGLRAVARLEMVVIIAMAAWFGTMLDWALRQRRMLPRVLAGLLVIAGSLEQFGTTDTFDARRMDIFERSIAAQLAGASCQAIFVTGTPDLLPTPIFDESRFDSAAYMAANQDVVDNWKGSPWSHYNQFGRAEGRVLDAQLAKDRALLAILGYNYTLPLAAVLAHVPVVNGLSGTEPPGWHLADVLSANTESQLASWLALNHKPRSSVCTLPIKVDIGMIPFLPRALWPIRQ